MVLSQRSKLIVFVLEFWYTTTVFYKLMYFSPPIKKKNSNHFRLIFSVMSYQLHFIAFFQLQLLTCISCHKLHIAVWKYIASNN